MSHPTALTSPHLSPHHHPHTSAKKILPSNTLSLSEHKPSVREPVPSSPDNKKLEVAVPRRLSLLLHLHRLSTLKPNDGANTAATLGLLPGTIAAGCQLQWACATISYSFHKAPAPQREDPAYCKCLHDTATAACHRRKTWKVTSVIGQTTIHTTQPCLTHQEWPRHWEQQISTLWETMDASSNLSKAAFILYKQAKTLNLYQALITRTTKKEGA